MSQESNVDLLISLVKRIKVKAAIADEVGEALKATSDAEPQITKRWTILVDRAVQQGKREAYNEVLDWVQEQYGGKDGKAS